MKAGAGTSRTSVGILGRYLSVDVLCWVCDDSATSPGFGVRIPSGMELGYYL